MREARLRPEFADLYPTLTPGQWEPAARIAEVVLARLLLLEISEAPFRTGYLNEEHFEFRGEDPCATGTPGAPGPLTRNENKLEAQAMETSIPDRPIPLDRQRCNPARRERWIGEIAAAPAPCALQLATLSRTAGYTLPG